MWLKMERKECAKYFGCKMGRVWLEDQGIEKCRLIFCAIILRIIRVI